jgi:hypothetical protein
MSGELAASFDYMDYVPQSRHLCEVEEMLPMTMPAKLKLEAAG